jgi:DNA (cytosine-5)-methyltransferase 1
MKLTHIDLFSGIGGFSLAARWAGLDTIVFCERDKFCQKVLNKHWPGVPIHDDITTFDGTKYSNVFLLTGGFPCQPFSCAGKRRGKEDDRYLWPEMLRVISEVKPRWIIGENVAGFIDMGLDDSISDLEREGYSVQTFVIPACAVNAPHRRDRVWIVAHTITTRTGCDSGEITDQRRQTGESGREGIRQGNRPISTGGVTTTDSHAPDPESEQTQPTKQRGLHTEFSGKDSDAADTCDTGLQGSERGRTLQSRAAFTHGAAAECGGNSQWTENWLEVATRLCRVDDGLPRGVDRVNRLKALGNAVVPQIPFVIMTGILDLYT